MTKRCNMKSKLSERIRERRIALGLSQENLAEMLGYTSRSTIAKIESGVNLLTQPKIEEFARVLKVSPAYLMGWSDSLFDSKENPFQYSNISLIQTQRVPMMGEIACGKPIFANEQRESYVQAGVNIKADFCLTARGDSMIGARIHDGDIVFCRSQNMVENGEIAAVIIGDEATLKRVYYYPEKQKLVLQAENPKYEPFVYVGSELDEINIIGKAIAFQSDVI